MKPVTQSRVGEDGTCFLACLASIFEVPESDIPDFEGDGSDKYWKQVQDFLGTKGLKYRRVPITGKHPVGYSTIEGISPRGGLHACIAKDGKLVHDPHPQDGTGRGLVEPRYYGLLEPAAKAKDRTDMLQLRKKTEAQGGPFFIQETTKDGAERTIPVRQLAKGADGITPGVIALFAALWAWYKAQHEEPELTYDLSKYQPKRKTFDVHGFPSVEELLRRLGWRMVNTKKREWNHSSYGTLDEEKAIELAYKDIATRKAMGH